MKLKKLLASILALTMVLSTMSFTVFAEDTDIIEVGTGKANETWSSAITAAVDGDEDGTITYHVYGKIVMDAYSIKGAATTINIIGMTDDAELSVETANPTDNGIVYISDDTIETVNISNLKLSRPNGEWRGNEGHHNRFFTIWDSNGSTDLITYTNCVFPNGSGNNQYGKTTYNECKFYNDVYYALWIYGSGSLGVAEVTDCYFEADRGVKIYSEDASATVKTTISDSEFKIESKPAIVSSVAGDLDIENVDATACEYGLLASEPKDGRTDLASAIVEVDGEAPVYLASVGNLQCTSVKYAQEEAGTSKEVEYTYGCFEGGMVNVEDPAATFITTSAKAVAPTESFVIEIYDANDTLLATTSAAQKYFDEFTGMTLSPSILTSITRVDDYWTTVWEDGMLNGKYVPAYGTMYIDGVEINSANIRMIKTSGEQAIEWYSVPGVNSGIITNAIQTVTNTDERQSIHSSLGKINADESVVVKYYNNDTLLVTSELADSFFENAPYIASELTVNTVLAGKASGSWNTEIVTPLTVDNIPNKMELYVDGILVDSTEDLYKHEVISTAELIAMFKAMDAVAAVAAIDGEKYGTIEAAIEAAKDGDTIVLLEDVTLDTYSIDGINLTIDINNNTLYRADSDNNKTTRANHNNGAVVTYKNGTIDIDDAVDSVAIFGTNVYTGTTAASMIFDDVVINGDGYNSGYAVFYLDDALENSLTITNSEINLANEQGSAGGVIKSEDANANVSISNTIMNLENVQRGFVNSEYTITESDIEFKNMNKTAFRNINGTITDSEIDMDNVDYGIENTGTATFNLQLLGTTSVQITNSKTYGVSVSATSTIDIADTAELVADSTEIADGAQVEDVVSKADTIYVQYKKTDIDADGNDTVEGQDKYEIVLAGADSETINELASADLTFEFVGTPANAGAMNYTVLPADGVTLSQIGDRYMFNYDGVTKYEETAAEIVIGTITIDGYGSYTLSTKDVETNAVYATEIRDNIVDGFEDAATLNINNDMVADDGMVGEITDGEITIPTRELAINITFPNAVVYNDAAYQDMTVTIVGGAYEEEIELGTEDTYAITRDLAYNTTYTVTVEGAGYRTARYSVVLTEDKVLNFWNNVKDNAMEVEEGKATSAVTKNFLAGDIVKDNNINVYDLSAVVSYFGTEGLSEENHPEYAKYDLNRDGIIDSKDVAYVLVSWGE